MDKVIEIQKKFICGGFESAVLGGRGGGGKRLADHSSHEVTLKANGSIGAHSALLSDSLSSAGESTVSY